MKQQASKNVKKQEETQTKNTQKQPKMKKRLYIGFGTRLTFNIILFLLLLISGTFLLNKSLIYENEETIKYDEKSNLDYRVYLHKNNFYEQEYLGKDMIYVASLIKNIQVDFDYLLLADGKADIDYNYSIVGKLSITNKEGTRSYFEKTYTLLDKKALTMRNASSQLIKETVNIDYGYYNTLANSFKTSYGIDADSNLTIYLVINKKNAENSNFKLDNSSMMNIVIPLSERSIDIKLDYKDINTSSTIIKEKGISVTNIITLIVAVILIILAIVSAIKAVRKLSLLHTKKSAYDKHIEKILKEYDRLIAETSTLMPFDKKDIIKISKFTELLDIHDNLQLPIMYYSIVKHHSSYFYINHDNTVYLLTVKATDFDGKNKKD